MSDRRLKDNIKLVKITDGIGVYEFNYKGQGVKYRGVMADEVAHIPGAVMRGADGFDRVDYSKLPVQFEVVNHGTH
jgi:hypothetical protein